MWTMAQQIFLLFMAALVETCLSQTFDYSDVAQWPQMFPNCGGQHQSPINIVSSTTQYNASLTSPPLTINYNVPANTSYLITNNGHSVQVTPQQISPSVGISGGGLPKLYSLYQFHFHWGNQTGQGSEHQVDGVAHDMEIHLVHYDSNHTYGVSANTSNGLAVLGIFVQVLGADNPGFQLLINYFQNITYANQNVTVAEFPITSLLPNVDLTHFYRYPGSLTTPYCYESVIWTILQYPINISLAQMTKFRTMLYELPYNASNPMNELLVDDYRPVQPLNGRTVWTSFPPMVTTPTESTSSTTKSTGGLNRGEVLRAGSVLVLQAFCLLLACNLF